MTKRRPRHIVRVALIGGAASLLLVLALRLAVHELPWFGPALADGLRRVFGTEAVTWLEESSARVEDRLRRSLASDSPPRSYEQAEQPQAELARPAAPQSSSRPAPAVIAERPQHAAMDVGPMDRRVAAAGDGIWRPVTDPIRPTSEPLLFATLLHPDPRRPWAEVFVVTVPVSRVRLYAVAGTVEPEATTDVGRQYVRRGLVPTEHQSVLLAAFNGGFMTKHGRHGMHVDGVTLVSPRPMLCTVLGLDDGTLRIASWRALKDEAARATREAQLVFWRQAAPCTYEQGRLNPLLEDESVRNWGATIDRDVVIRRSAIGLDSARSRLYIGISNDTTAPAIARAMHHAGASDVAQLDVNWSYPKFLLYERGSAGQLRARGLFEGFVFRPDEYVVRPSQRDFFYLVRRQPVEQR